jgi:hypothetical protein
MFVPNSLPASMEAPTIPSSWFYRIACVLQGRWQQRQMQRSLVPYQLSIGENSNYIGEGAVRYTELSVLHWKRHH